MTLHSPLMPAWKLAQKRHGVTNGNTLQEFVSSPNIFPLGESSYRTATEAYASLVQ